LKYEFAASSRFDDEAMLSVPNRSGNKGKSLLSWYRRFAFKEENGSSHGMAAVASFGFALMCGDFIYIQP
jgi:hypothetical protein